VPDIIPDLVSTIIPVYNRAVFLGEAVRSVIAQTYRPIEIILVDDGSTDDTPLLIEELRSQSADVIRVLRIVNGGPGVAREAGRQVARGEFIQYLDSDDVLEPCKFAEQVKALRENIDCGVAYGITRLIDENGNELVNPYKWSGQKHEFLFPGLLVERWWNTHTPLYRRSVCDAVGPWTSERMGEDWQYDARIGGLKTKLAFCPVLVSSHRDHNEGRLTRGKLSCASARDSAQLIPVLYAEALKAGISPTSNEMSFFSRWSFLTTRNVARFGLPEVHQVTLDTAIKASQSKSMDIILYQKFTKFFGCRLIGIICELIDRLRFLEKKVDKY